MPTINGNESVEEIQKIHEQVKAKIEKSNMSYQVQAKNHRMKVVFQPGDPVWIYLRNIRISFQQKNKLMP